MFTLTIPNKLIKDQELMVVEKKSFDDVVKENAELRLAMQSIIAGEFALRSGKTRSFSQFLKHKFPRYAKNR